ncbi:MAG: metallophosphoesterase [Bacteroidota bacterium]
MSANAAFFIWMGIMVLTLGVGFTYMGWRLIIPFKLVYPFKQLAWTALALLYLIPFSSFFLVRYAEKSADALAWVGYIGLGLISFTFTLLVIRDAALLIGLSADKIFAFFAQKNPAVDAGKREFLVQTTNLGVIGVASVLTAYGVYEARKKPSIVNVDIPIANLPEAFNGFKIAQISDIHAGLTIKRDWIETVTGEVMNIAPDLIAFTGDMVDGSVDHLRNDVAPLGDLTAPHGKYFVTGNHEYYSGAGPWVDHARILGFDVLMNEHRILSKDGSSIVLAGVTDYSGGQFQKDHASDPVKALHGAPSGTTRILMAHQPRSLYQTEGLDLDLVLMGHTHGGQFFPWNLVATIGQPFIKGLNKFGEKTWAYVSKGTGYWGPPVRVGARSEITVVTLRKA